MKRLISAEEARQKTIERNYFRMENDIPYCSKYYRKYMERITKEIDECIIRGDVAFIHEGDAGNIPGRIEALLLLEGYSIERKDSNSFIIYLINKNN